MARSACLTVMVGRIFHPDESPPIKESYRRNLPHIQPPGATFFLTFRLSGSLPQSVIDQRNKERQWLEHVARTNPSHHERVKPDFQRKWFAKFELLLDGATFGPVWLRDPQVAKIVADSLHHRDGKGYRLDAFSIMPNYVHTIIKPLPIVEGEDGGYHALPSIMQSLKGYTSFKCNRLLGQKGEFWAHESYDHWVRDADEWQRIVAYVVNNPVKAGYVKRWQDWKWNYRRV